MVDRVVYLFVRAVALFVLVVVQFFYFFSFVCVNTAKRRAGEVFAPSSMFQLSCIVNYKEKFHTSIIHAYNNLS